MAVPLGIVLLWLGYSIGYYGYNRITGGNDKFINLVYPGRYTATTRDGGQGAGPSPAGGAPLPGAPAQKAPPAGPSPSPLGPSQNPQTGGPSTGTQQVP